MKKTNVYMCNKGHLFYCDDPPEICKYCGGTEFGQISGITVDVDDDGENSDESSYNKY